MRTNSIAALTFALGLVLISTSAQAQSFVFPEKGQSAEQQQQDEFACHQWAKQQTGIDPNQQMAGAPPSPPQQGGALRGAAGGAALGAIGGAIGGNAGKGAAIGAATGALVGGFRRADQRRAAEQSQAQASAAYGNANAACLEGRGYTVK